MDRLSVAVTLVVALMVAAIVVEPNLTSFYALLLIPIFGVSMRHDWSGIGRSIARHRVGILVAAGFLVIAALSVMWAYSDTAIVLRRSAKLTGVAALLLAVILLPLSHQRARPMVRPMAQPMIRSVMIGVIFGAVLVALFLIENAYVGTIRSLITQPTDIHNWYNLHKLPATILALLMFPVAMAVWRSDRQDGLPPVMRLAAGVALCGVLFSGHITAIAALAVGVLAGIVSAFWPRIVAASVWGAAALMLFVVPVTIPLTNINPVLTATAGQKSLQHRVLILDFASQRIAERPWLGWGLDASRFLPGGSDRVADTPARLIGSTGGRIDPDTLHHTVLAVAQNLPLHPHNLLLQIRLELGVPGALMALLALAVALLAVLEIRDRIGRALSLGVMVSAACIASFGFGAWQSWWLAALILTVAVCRLALHMMQEDTQSP